jgi:hypothetical protein
MNPLAIAVQNIKYNIPDELLQIAFKSLLPNLNYREVDQYISIDEQILSLIIRPRVLLDCNLVGGEQAIIPLDGIVPTYLDNYAMVYRIPKSKTQNRSIISALSVGYLPYLSSGYGSTAPYLGYGATTMNGSSEITTTAMRIMDSLSSIPPIGNANVQLIGENMVLIKDSFRTTQSYFLRCILANEENLGNLSPRSYPEFSKLCLLAVKSYLYNFLIVKMDQGFIVGGQTLGSVKNIIDSYVDSEEQYQAQLREVFSKVLFMNDQPTYTRFLRSQINPTI